MQKPIPPMSLIPQPGQLVHVRQRRSLVEDVTLPPIVGDATLVELAGVDDDTQGQPLQVLWEHELDAEILSGEAWTTLGQRGFDPPARFMTHAIRDLAPRFEHRLFLSATPHNGHSNSFSALLELLDPQRSCRGGAGAQGATGRGDGAPTQGGFTRGQGGGLLQKPGSSLGTIDF